MKNEVWSVKDSYVETIHIVRPTHLNAAGRLFGGILMQWIDETAGVVAKRHCKGNVITASIDNLMFLKGAYQQDMIVLIGKLTYVGRTSMEVRIDTYKEDMQGTRTKINRAYITMVAMDENDEPTEVPRLSLTTQEEKSEWEAAIKRREMRKLRKEEGF